MDQKEIESQAVALRTEAESFVVCNQETYNIANAFGQKIKLAMKAIDAYCDPVIEAAHKTHKAACDQKKALYAPLEAAKKVIDGKQIAWYKAEQERVAEEQRKAEEEAKRKAEEEALANAQVLHEMGLDEAAEEAISQPVVIEKVTVAGPEKAGGESFRETWSAEVVDLMALVKAVAAGTQPLAYLQANMQALNSAARMFKGTMPIPGVRIYSDVIIARRTP